MRRHWFLLGIDNAWVALVHVGAWRIRPDESHTQVCKGFSLVPDAPAFVPPVDSAVSVNLAPIVAELVRLTGEDYRIMDRADTAHGIACVAATEVERLGSLIHDLDKARPITVTVNGRDAVDVGRQHEILPNVGQMVSLVVVMALLVKLPWKNGEREPST